MRNIQRSKRMVPLDGSGGWMLSGYAMTIPVPMVLSNQLSSLALWGKNARCGLI